jgi:phenylalanyl-tRNA synthetase alpha subunit
MLMGCRYVDSGFWNFDALFVPQQHPARDMQDSESAIGRKTTAPLCSASCARFVLKKNVRDVEFPHLERFNVEKTVRSSVENNNQRFHFQSERLLIAQES